MTDLILQMLDTFETDRERSMDAIALACEELRDTAKLLGIETSKVLIRALPKCWGCGSPDVVAYHLEEWFCEKCNGEQEKRDEKFKIRLKIVGDRETSVVAPGSEPKGAV